MEKNPSSLYVHAIPVATSIWQLILGCCFVRHGDVTQNTDKDDTLHFLIHAEQTHSTGRASFMDPTVSAVKRQRHR